MKVINSAGQRLGAAPCSVDLFIGVCVLIVINDATVLGQFTLTQQKPNGKLST